MKENPTIDFWYMKDLLNKDEGNIFVHVESSDTLITFLSSTKAISSDPFENKGWKFKNVVESAEELLRLANENNNFSTIKCKWRKLDDIWHIYDGT